MSIPAAVVPFFMEQEAPAPTGEDVLIARVAVSPFYLITINPQTLGVTILRKYASRQLTPSRALDLFNGKLYASAGSQLNVIDLTTFDVSAISTRVGSYGGRSLANDGTNLYSTSSSTLYRINPATPDSSVSVGSTGIRTFDTLIYDGANFRGFYQRNRLVPLRMVTINKNNASLSNDVATNIEAGLTVTAAAKIGDDVYLFINGVSAVVDGRRRAVIQVRSFDLSTAQSTIIGNLPPLFDGNVPLRSIDGATGAQNVNLVPV